MPTQVTSPSGLSSITKALPSLSPNDICTLQSNIATLLKPTDDDDDAKMESIPNLSEPDLDDFSLGSLETTNIINNHVDNYLTSLTTFPKFSSHIPSSVVGTSIHSTQFTTNPLQALPTPKKSIQNTLHETKTPRTVSFAANITPVSAATVSKLPSMTSKH